MSYFRELAPVPDNIKIELNKVSGLERLLKLDGFVAETAKNQIRKAWINYYKDRLARSVFDVEQYVIFGSMEIQKVIGEYKMDPQIRLEEVIKQRLDRRIEEIVHEERRKKYAHDVTTENIGRDDCSPTRCS